MGEDPAAIRSEVAETRARMDETIDALAYKADVPSRARESVADKVDAVKSKVTGARASASDATPSTGDVKAKGKQAVGVAQSNPLGLAIGSVAIGFLAGLLIPSTAIEDEKIGDVADQVKGQIKGTAQEAVQHGKEVAQETAQAATQAAKETAQSSGQSHAEDLKGSAQDSAQEARAAVSS